MTSGATDLATGRSPLIAERGAGPLRRLAPLAVSAACVGLLAWVLWDQLPAAWRVMREADPAVLGLATLVYPLAWYALAVRLGVVFGAFDFHQPSYRFFLYSLVGQFFDLLLPTSIGGDIVKAGYAAGRRDRVAEALLATLVDRGVGLIGTVLVGSVGLVFFPAFGVDPTLLWLPVAIAAGLAALIVASRLGRWIEWTLGQIERAPLAERLRLPRLARAVVGLLRTPYLLPLTLLLSLAAHACSTLALWLTARALGIEAAYPALLLVVPVVTLAALLPSIKLVGLREAAFVVLLQTFLPEEEALALTLVFSGIRLVWTTAGGVAFLLRKPLGLSLPTRAAGGVRS